MTLKKLMGEDLSIIFDREDFADLHTICVDGKTIKAVGIQDNSMANNFEGAQINGVFKEVATVYIRQGELVPSPAVGTPVQLNGVSYFCRSCGHEQGVDVLVLERKGS